MGNRERGKIERDRDTDRQNNRYIVGKIKTETEGL